jgi:chorismate mutase
MKKKDSIGFWRKKIDKLNLSILRLLNRRVQAACRIGRIKRKKGKAISDRVRERTILKRLLKMNIGPADDQAIKNVFKVIIKETKRLERTKN